MYILPQGPKYQSNDDRRHVHSDLCEKHPRLGHGQETKAGRYCLVGMGCSYWLLLWLSVSSREGWHVDRGMFETEMHDSSVMKLLIADIQAMILVDRGFRNVGLNLVRRD